MEPLDCKERVERFCTRHMELVQRIEIAKKTAGLTKGITFDAQLTYSKCYQTMIKLCKNPPSDGKNPLRKHVINTSP